MDFKQLGAFVNWGKAMDGQLAIKQSGLTVDELMKIVKSLEQELGVKVIDMQDGKASLTPIGAAILPFAENITQDHTQLLTAVADYRKKERDQAVKLAVLPAFDNYHAASYLKDLSHDHKILLTEESNPLAQLQAGECDVAFISYAGTLPDDVESLPVGTDRLVAYVPTRNPLSQQLTVALTDLKAEKFLTLNHRNPLAAFVEQTCDDAGVYVYSVFEGERGQTLVNMVALGMGITLLMEQSVSSKLDSKVTKIPITPEIHQNLAFIRLKDSDHTPAQDRLWEDLHKSVQN